MSNYPPDFDHSVEDPHCPICNRHVEDCECPECKACKGTGYADGIWGGQMCLKCEGKGVVPEEEEEAKPEEQYLYPLVKSYIRKEGGYEFACFDTHGKKLHRDRNLLEVFHTLREVGYSFFRYPKDNKLHNVLDTINRLEIAAEQKRLDDEFDKF